MQHSRRIIIAVSRLKVHLVANMNRIRCPSIHVCRSGGPLVNLYQTWLEYVRLMGLFEAGITLKNG